MKIQVAEKYSLRLVRNLDKLFCLRSITYLFKHTAGKPVTLLAMNDIITKTTLQLSPILYIFMRLSRKNNFDVVNNIYLRVIMFVFNHW